MNPVLPFDRKAERTILRDMKKEREKEVLLEGLGARVRALRLGADLNVSQFAERASLSPRFINQLACTSCAKGLLRPFCYDLAWPLLVGARSCDAAECDAARHGEFDLLAR